MYSSFRRPNASWTADSGVRSGVMEQASQRLPLRRSRLQRLCLTDAWCRSSGACFASGEKAIGKSWLENRNGCRVDESPHLFVPSRTGRMEGLSAPLHRPVEEALRRERL